MLYYLTKYLSKEFQNLSFLRLLSDYITFRAFAAAIGAFLVVLLIGNKKKKKLNRKKIRNVIRDYQELSPSSKLGIPTMGGIIIITAITSISLLFCKLSNLYFIWVIIAMFWFGTCGAIDDYLKIKSKDSDKGLSQNSKLLMQVLFAIVFSGFYLSDLSPLPFDQRSLLYLPFFKSPIMDLGFFYIPFILFFILAVSNSINFADGMDGLAISTVSLTTIVYAFFAYIMSNSLYAKNLLFPYLPGSEELVIFLAIVIGAALGFTWFNCYPAQVIMGDTGSMALGGILSISAILIKQEFLFIIAGGIFVAEGFSVLIQEKIGIGIVGKRFFFRAPLHHTFQHKGLGESKIVFRFLIIGIILSLLSIATVKIR